MLWIRAIKSKDESVLRIKTTFVVIFGHKSNGKPIDCRMVYPTTMKLAPNVCWFILMSFRWIMAWYVIDLVMVMCLMDHGSPEKKHWWWTQWLWKGNLGLLCSVLFLKVQDEGAQTLRGWKNEIYLFIFGGWKNLYFEYNSETNIEADYQKQSFLS